MIVVNFFGGPGVGKSTLATRVFAELKCTFLEAEYCHEWIKWELWAKNKNIVDDQLTIFANQHRLQWSLQGQCDVCVCDSPLLLSLIYGQIYLNGFIQDSAPFYDLVRERFNSYDNMNFFIERKWTFEQGGRYQDETDARILDVKIYDKLIEEGINFDVISPTDDMVGYVSHLVEEMHARIKS